MFKIAHISDLHFGIPDQSYHQFEELIRSIAKERPDLIIVSGDLVDSPKSELFTGAYNELLRLCDACKIKDPKKHLFIVPGNHDVWAHGIGTGDTTEFERVCGLHFRPFTKQAHDWGTFTHGDDIITISCINSNPARFVTLGSIKKKVLTILHKVIAGEFAGAYAESINTVALARGLVRDEEFVYLRRRLSDLRNQFKTKIITSIVVLHHHPLAHTEPSSVGADQSLCLINAGDTVYRFQKFGVNLVLHGHKHTPFIADGPRFLPSAEQSSFAVISCGSSGHPIPDERHNKQFQWNLIEIGTSGAIRANTFTGDGHYFSPVHDEAIVLRSCENYNLLCINRLEQESAFTASKRCRKIYIDEYGNARTVHKVVIESISDKADGRVDLPVAGISGRVYLPHGVLRFNRKKTTCSASRVGLDHILKETPTEISGTIRLTRVTKNDLPLTLTYQIEYFNAYSSSTADISKLYDQPEKMGGYEHIVMSLVYPVFQHEVTCTFSSNEIADSARVNVVRDSDDTEVPDEIERVGNSMEILANNVLIKIRNPNPNYNYILQWKPTESKSVLSFSEKGECEKRQEKLQTLNTHRQSKTPVYQQVQDLLEKAAQKLSGDRLEIVVFGFVGKSVIPIAANSTDENLYKLQLRWGQGVAGRCFKYNDTMVYVRRKAEEEPEIDVFCEVPGMVKPELVLCVPIKLHDTPMAVISVASWTLDPKLLKVADKNDEISKEVSQVLTQAWTSVKKLIGI